MDYEQTGNYKIEKSQNWYMAEDIWILATAVQSLEETLLRYHQKSYMTYF
jgi:hypothetical protein